MYVHKKHYAHLLVELMRKKLMTSRLRGPGGDVHLVTIAFGNVNNIGLKEMIA